jgi:urease accessory protein UreE
MTKKEAMIDPKNPYTVGKSAWNLGNHTLTIMFTIAISWVIWVSYQ